MSKNATEVIKSFEDSYYDKEQIEKEVKIIQKQAEDFNKIMEPLTPNEAQFLVYSHKHGFISDEQYEEFSESPDKLRQYMDYCDYAADLELESIREMEE